MNFSGDPLLNYNASQTMQADTNELIKQIAMLEQKSKAIRMQAQVSPTPLWDEIDKIEDSLTDGQRQYLMQNKEYVESFQYVSKLVQDEELRIIRPRIEITENGKEALKKHLSIVQRLRKDLAKEEEQRNTLLNDYLTNHSDMTYKDYIAMVSDQKEGKKGGRK